VGGSGCGVVFVEDEGGPGEEDDASVAEKAVEEDLAGGVAGGLGLVEDADFGELVFGASRVG